MDIKGVINTIIELKEDIEESAINNEENCEDFLGNTLNKSPDKMPPEHLKLWRFAFQNVRNWNRVIEQFKSDTNTDEKKITSDLSYKNTIERESSIKPHMDRLKNENNSIKKVKSKPVETNKKTEIVYESIEKALIVIEFYTKLVHGKNIFRNIFNIL